MVEIIGSNGDIQLIRDGKTFFPKKMELSFLGGTVATWRQRHWNTGEYEPECDNRALDIYHPQPQGLRKPKEPDLERANPYQWKCVHCGTRKVYGAAHYVTKYRYGGGYCETWIDGPIGWKLFAHKEW